MIFKKFRYIAIFYLVGIMLLTGLGFYILFNTYFWLTAFWVFLLDLGLGIVFLRFVGNEHKKLAHFLISVNQGDFTAPFSKNYQDLDLNMAFEHLSDVIISLREDAQINYQYLQTVVNNINTAIICIDDLDNIVLSNNSAKKLFDKNVLRNKISLKSSYENLPNILIDLKSNEKKLIKFNKNGELFNYSIQLAEFKIHKKYFKLFSFQNIQSELEQNELESWQKLTRVMAHEIMNSSIPISNLSGLVYKKLFNKGDKLENTISLEQVEDVKEGLKTIESRSKGLVSFVEATRNFTIMPKPELEEIIVEELIKRVVNLFKPQLTDKRIDLQFNIRSKNIKILVDKSLVEQALINLLLNAIDAVEETKNPKIEINLSVNNENKTIVSVKDNGRGISTNDLDNIFIPFYTTKSSGSGIGLSLTKQIMFLHKGNISVKSKPKHGTEFVISF